MKTLKNRKEPEITAETITVLTVDSPLPKALKTGLGHAAAPHWVSGGKLYILNCTLDEKRTFVSRGRHRRAATMD